MACGVLADAGTPYIYCVGGSAAGPTTATSIAYSATTRLPTNHAPVADRWPACQGTILPGGFTVLNNKLYILGGFDISNEHRPTRSGSLLLARPLGAEWTTVLPVPLGYVSPRPLSASSTRVEATDITAGAVTDTTNSFASSGGRYYRHDCRDTAGHRGDARA